MTQQRRLPIVRSDDGTGRSLVAVIAVLALLAGLAVGAAAIVVASSAEWRSAIAREATIQVRPLPGRDLDGDVARAVDIARTTLGIGDARPLTRADGERLLEPWLGRGLDLSDLPVPRLVILSLAGPPRPDLATLAARLTSAMPSATLDDHAIWLARLSLAANSVALVAAAVLLLVFSASGAAIAFATRGVIAGQDDVIDVLHFVGASDVFIARGFAGQFAQAGLRGGLIGSVAAAALVAVGTHLADRGAGPEMSQAQALFGSFAIGPWGYGAILAVGLVDGALAGLVARSTVRRFLNRTYGFSASYSRRTFWW